MEPNQDEDLTALINAARREARRLATSSFG